MSLAGSWQAGAVIAEFRLLEPLGEGGMGAVFLCEHLGSGGRYAIKSVPPDAPPLLIERFLREGEAQARVDGHENVLRVRTAGTWQGRPYLVMDLATGGDLYTRLRNGPLDPDHAAEVVAALARGLHHVHQRGILHRDLKPRNVMFNGEGTPLLVDFGVARLDEAQRLTMTGQAVGTPAYMAPEQLGGGRDEIGPWTDVYGLGCVLYASLTGRSPFQGTAGQVMKAVVTDEPESIRKLQPDVPPELAAICRRAMSKERGDRYPDAAELAEALAGYLRGDGAPAAGGGSQLLIVPALVAALGLVAAGIALLGGQPPEPAPPAPSLTQAAASSPLPATPQGPRRALRRGDEPGQWINEVDGSILVEVALPAGSGVFSMGSADPFLASYEWYRPEDYRPHPVRLTRRYLIGLHEVTWEQYRRFLVESGVDPQADTIQGQRIELGDGTRLEGEGRWPAIGVSYDEALAYCKWAGLRLPTEAEWEWAARGPVPDGEDEANYYPWGRSAISFTTGLLPANMADSIRTEGGPDDGFRGLAPVMNYPQGRSWCGAYDMAGNVTEWVSDWFGPYPEATEPVVDPQGPPAGNKRITRGGDWDRGLQAAHSARRDDQVPSARKGGIGFRVAADLPE